MKMNMKQRITIATSLTAILLTTTSLCNEPKKLEWKDNRNEEELIDDFEGGMVGKGLATKEFCNDYPEHQQEIINQITNDLILAGSTQPYPSLRNGVEAGLNELFVEEC